MTEIPAFTRAKVVLRAVRAHRRPVTIAEIVDWISRNTPERMSEQQCRRHALALVDLDLLERDDSDKAHRFKKKS